MLDGLRPGHIVVLSENSRHVGRCWGWRTESSKGLHFGVSTLSQGGGPKTKSHPAGEARSCAWLGLKKLKRVFHLVSCNKSYFVGNTDTDFHFPNLQIPSPESTLRNSISAALTWHDSPGHLLEPKPETLSRQHEKPATPRLYP